MKRSNIDKCRELRKKQTDAERKLWALLRNRQLAGVKFRRQFSLSRYILDFYAPEYRLCIEADGGQHYEYKGRQRDEFRTKELNKLGVEILRFSDREILTNIEGVPLTSILSPKGEDVIESKIALHPSKNSFFVTLNHGMNLFHGLIQGLITH